MIGFRRIGHRILSVVGLVVFTGLVAVIFLYAERQERSILEQNERALIKVTHSVKEALEAVMLKGYGDVGHEFAARLRSIRGVVDYRLLRIDGREAFIDNQTLIEVNARQHRERFKLRPDAVTAQVVDPGDPRWRRLMAEQKRQLYYEDLPGQGHVVTVLEPVLADDSCTDCHGEGSPVRGIIKLTTPLDTVDSDISNTRLMSILVVGAGVLFIFSAVYLVAQRSVVRPIRTVTRAMSVAARGDLSVKVPVTGQDEIGRMAESFNQMSGQLARLYDGLQDEQNKLTTIILGAREGIIVTDAENRVVLVNPAAAAILGKSEQRIIADGIFQLIDNPSWMTWRLGAGADEKTAGVVEYKGRILSIQASTTRGSSGHITGSAAIVRDITEEKRLEAELKRLAVTDGLTGLYNRRYFDQTMDNEYQRAQRYQSSFCLLLLDVDHFKKLNDSHGHDAGDRVLKAIGGLLNEIVVRQRPLSAGLLRISGMACRYGGEEMAIVLPEQTLDDALALAETIRREVESLRVDGLQVTASLGVASCGKQHCAPADIVASADEALYRAKAEGRNCVRIGR